MRDEELTLITFVHKKQSADFVPSTPAGKEKAHNKNRNQKTTQYG